MKVNFGKVYIQSTIRQNGDKSVIYQTDKLIEEGRHRNTDYFVTEFDYYHNRHDYGKAYRVEAYKNNKKISQKVYPANTFINGRTRGILDMEKNIDYSIGM